MKRFLSISVIGFIAGFCLTLLVDCSCASPDWRQGTVTDKIIRPAWTEFHTERGRTSITYHPEEYYICAEVNGKTGRLEVAFWNYDSWRVGQTCEVQFRRGKLMTYGYLSLRHTSW